VMEDKQLAHSPTQQHHEFYLYVDGNGRHQKEEGAPPVWWLGEVLQRSAQKQQLLLACFSVLVSLFEREGIVYWLCGGTLIGAERHENFIPHVSVISSCWLLLVVVVYIVSVGVVVALVLYFKSRVG
jgi:hypothetical protein